MDKIGVVELRRQEGLPPAKCPADGTQVWMAIDISRSKAVYCVRWEGSEQRRLSTPLGIEHVRALLEHYHGCQVHIAYEACGFGYELAWWLQEHGVAVMVIAPSRVERMPGLQVKTDRVDVGKLARKLEKGDLTAVYIPRRPVHEQRQLGRTYAQCLKERKRAQVRIRSLLQEHGRLGPLPAAGWKVYSAWLSEQSLPEPIRLCVQAHQQMRGVADQQAQRMKAELYKLARSAEYRPLVKALSAQSGVGWQSGEAERRRSRCLRWRWKSGRTPTPWCLRPAACRSRAPAATARVTRWPCHSATRWCRPSRRSRRSWRWIPCAVRRRA